MVGNSSNDYSQRIFSQYEIVRRIFSYLSMPDLRNCSHVCHLWKEIAVLTEKSRLCLQVVCVDKDTVPFLKCSAALSLCLTESMTEEIAHATLESDEVIQHTAQTPSAFITEASLSKRSSLPLVARFPKTDGVSIQVVDLNLDWQEVNKTLDSLRKVQIKAIMIMIGFGDERMGLMMGRCLQTLHMHHSNFAAGGFYTANGGGSVELGNKLIIFSGNSIEAASLGSRVCSDTKMFSKLEKFSKCVTVCENSILYVFHSIDEDDTTMRSLYKAIDTIFKTCQVVVIEGVGNISMTWQRWEEEPATNEEGLALDEYLYRAVFLFIRYKA